MTAAVVALGFDICAYGTKLFVAFNSVQKGQYEASIAVNFYGFSTDCGRIINAQALV